MSKSYALKRLLEHGGLKLCDIFIITGWSWEDCRSTVSDLLKAKEIRATHNWADYTPTYELK